MTTNRKARTWTPEAVQQLKKMWEEGMNTRLIAEKLGMSKNAVIGKAGYLNLTRRKKKTFVAQDGTQSTTKKRVTMVSKFGHFIPANMDTLKLYQPMVHVPLPGVTPKELIDLREKECRWPFGHLPDLLFCGAGCMKGSQYCEIHFALSRKPTKKEAISAPVEEIEDDVDVRSVV